MIKILLLDEAPETISSLAEAFHAEWPNTPIETIAARFRLCAQRHELPVALVAVEERNVCGAVALLHTSVRARPELGPWLAALYVAPDYRRRGLGAQLVRRAEAEAGRLGLATLYAGTSTAVSIFTRLGWNLIESVNEAGEDISILKKNIG